MGIAALDQILGGFFEFLIGILECFATGSECCCCCCDCGSDEPRRKKKPKNEKSRREK